MKKIMLLAAMLAMVLMATVPAFAQDAGDAVADDESTATGGDVSVQYVDCSQVQAALGAQGQYGDATATADDEGVASAEIAQELGISQQQVNGCIGGVNTGPVATPDTGGASLFALGGGALLVAGGLLARRIIR